MLLMPVYTLLIPPFIFENKILQHTERSATLKINTNSGVNLNLSTSMTQKNSVNELLRFLKKMAASKPTLKLS